MFRATLCPSSGEITVFMWHLDDCLVCRVQTGQSSTQSDKYQVSHRYSYFCWWWAHSHPKHVEKRNERTKKNCAPSWLYLQDYTRMHGQQNIKTFKKMKWGGLVYLYTDSDCDTAILITASCIMKIRIYKTVILPLGFIWVQDYISVIKGRT